MSVSRSYPKKKIPLRDAPLNACQDSSNIIRGTPSILQDIQTELPSTVHVRMEHLADEFDTRRLVRIRLLEVHDEPKCPILEGGVGGSDNDGVPVFV